MKLLRYGESTLAAFVLSVAAVGCPDEKDGGGEESGCIDCHRPEGQVGIEVPHPLFAVPCGDCHGGDPTGDTVGKAHVSNPGTVDIREMPLVTLRSPDTAAFRRFLNPGDPVAAPESCGNMNPQAGPSGGCHADKVRTSLLSVHMTAPGVTNLHRYSAGFRSEIAPALAPVEVGDPEFGAGAPEDAVGFLFPVELADMSLGTPANPKPFLDHALGKACTGCHLSIYGVGEYRSGAQQSSGCSGCHLPYNEDARSESTDPFIMHDEAGHPARHVVELRTTDRQCRNCHYRSTRIGMQWRGIRERTVTDVRFGLTSPTYLDEDVFGRPENSFIVDDDNRDNLDLTPPDIHMQKGMSCLDCHMGQDVHGSGHIRASMGYETGVECVDCHGTFEDVAGANGTFMTSGGAALSHVRREGDRVLMRSFGDGKDHVVTQLKVLEETLATEALDNAHSDSNHGKLECYACHTSWMQNVYGLRMSLDLRHKSTDPITGQESDGRVTEENELTTLGNIHLGINADGMIGTFMAYNLLFDVIEPCTPSGGDPTCVNSPEEPLFGRRVVQRYVPDSAEGNLGLTFIPVFAHTTADRSTVQPCERCHPRQFELDDARVRATYGYGTQTFSVVLSGSATTDPVDLARYVDDQGEAIVSFSQPGVGPIPRTRAMRPLDYEVPSTLR